MYPRWGRQLPQYLRKTQRFNMSRIIVIVSVISVAIFCTSSAEENDCLRYDYEEKLLSKVIRMEIRLEQLETKLAENPSQVRSERHPPCHNGQVTGFGDTYIRWGRTVCGGKGTQLVYKGMAGGSHYEHTGAASNYLCLPEDPEWARYDDAKNGKGGYVFGTEYQVGDGSRELFEGQKIEGTYVENSPCAVCQAPRQTVLMIPGKLTCPDGWNVEYNGYLMAGRHDHKAASEYICLDDTPEVVPGGSGNDNENLFYIVEARCGGLKCPPYVDGREITCVVCSK